MENQTLQGDGAIRSKLSAVKDGLVKAGIQWVVFAGAAACCYGSKRRVTDIDILVKGIHFGESQSCFKGY